MISAVAYRQQLQSDKNKFFSLFTRNRGRVLTGYGGSLAGYNTSLMQKQADLTDQLMQKKYESGEITLNDLTAHLKKTLDRPWLSVEEKRLVTEQIRNLQVVEQDKIVDAKYKAGDMTARDVANYEKTKLLGMTPGSEAYAKQQAQVDEWSQQANKDEVGRAESDAVARASAYLNDPVQYYTQLQKEYQTLSADAAAKGLPEEANNFTVKAADAGAKLQSEQAAVSKTQATDTRDQIVQDFNLAVNDYHDNKITGQDLLAKIDNYERQAIQNNQTDLLDNFNKWVDYVNEDLIYGKAASRGGTRRGTGKGATDTGWDSEDAMFSEDIKWLQGELLKGTITSSDYVTKLATALDRRKQVIDSRLAELDGLDSTDKVIYEGSKSTVETVKDKLTKERDQNWGRALGFTASQSGNVGLDALTEDIMTNGGQYVPVISQTGTGPGAKPKLDLIDVSLVGSDYIQDDKGRFWKIQTKKTGRDTISGADYNALLQSNPTAAADYEPQIDANGNITGATNKKIQNVNYVDIFGADGSKIRYFLDASGKIIDYTPDVKNQPSNAKDLVGTPTSFQSPEDFMNQVKGVQSQTPTTDTVNMPKDNTPTGSAFAPLQGVKDFLGKVYPGAKPPAAPQPPAPKPSDIIPAGTNIAPETSQNIVKAAQAPAVQGPSSSVIDAGTPAARVPKEPQTMLTPPDFFTKQYEPLSRAMAGQNISVQAPPQISGLPTMDQANQRLIQQAAKRDNPQPNLLDKTKQFISSIFKRK